MLVVREIMYCKPGKVRPMVDKFLAMSKLGEKMGMPKMKVMTDLSAERYWTLVAEMEVPSMKAFEDMMSGQGQKPEDTKEFDDYVADMLWAQDYARANREQMMDALLDELTSFIGAGSEVQRINCHHNYSERERHDGVELWITRKGAIRAGKDDRGVIPGSMGNDIHIVHGLGNPASYESCAHGAGRRHSRRQAKKRFTVEQLRREMEGRAWNRDRAGALLDEIPEAYKDLAQVMADQIDLVEAEHSMREILNYKGS